MENSRRGAPKFTCYFCNKTIENETEMGHTAQCGRVLVACPNRCGSYIPRMEARKHSKECVNRTVKSTPKSSVSQEYYPIDPRNNFSNTLGKNGITKTDNQNEIYKLSRKIVDLETRFQISRSQNQSFVTLQNFETLKSAQLQLNLDIEKLKYQSQIAFDWRTKIDALFNQLRENLSTVEGSRRQIEVHLTSLQTRIMLMEKLQDQINNLKDSFLREQAYNRQVDMNFNDNIDDFRKNFAQENAKNLAILSDLKDSMSSVQFNIDDLSSKLEDQGIKFTNVIFDLKNTSQVATEANHRVLNLEKEFEEIKKDLKQIKLDMEILEGLSSSNDMRLAPGRLLWKITEVDSKLVEAKQSGYVLKSPIFFTHEYGYRVRILMYLNGLKKWKDRYALLCLHVLKGEFDMTLKWPCQIEGTIILRDLEDLEKAKPFTKVITAKRQNGDEECEDPQESSSCYIFIPHTTLLKSNYIKNDTMFLDIKIRQNGKLETNL